MSRIRCYMLGVEWRTVAEIRRDLETLYPDTHFPECSISAQLRNLKKPAFGDHRLEKRRRGAVPRGLWEYLLSPPAPDLGGLEQLRLPIGENSNAPTR